MGFSGLVKMIKDFASGTPSDDDNFLFGNTSIKKITFKALKTALGIDKLNADVSTINSALTFDNKELFLNYFGHRAQICKIGQVKQLIYWNEFLTPLTMNTKYSLSTLPSNYAPKIIKRIYIEIVVDGSYETYPAAITIETTGEIFMTPLKKDTKKCSCSFSFMWI